MHRKGNAAAIGKKARAQRENESGTAAETNSAARASSMKKVQRWERSGVRGRRRAF